MRKRILSLALTLAMLVAFVPFATPTTAVAASMFPYVLDGPYTNVDEWGWTFWNPPTAAIRQADIMVVEYEGARISEYMFTRHSETWVEFASGDNSAKSRMKEESGKITFDMHGIDGDRVGFRVEKASDAAKIKRVYLDVLPVAPNLSAKTIYVDAKNANAGDGTQANPYKSLADATKNAKTSDTIIVADGTYYGTITLPSGTDGKPTTLKAAPGAKPVITPTVPLNAAWSVYKDNIYVADISSVSNVIQTDYPQLFSGGVSMIEARYPNLPGSDMSSVMKQKRAVAQAGTNASTIVVPDTIPSDIAGASVVIWAGTEGLSGWHSIKTPPIKAVNGKTVTLESPMKRATWDENPDWDYSTAHPGNPFYIVGALALLDAPGEYYYDKASKKLYFYAPDGGDPSRLSLSMRSNNKHAIVLSAKYVTVDGFDIYGGGINIMGGNNTIQNCSVRYAGYYYDGDMGNLNADDASSHDFSIQGYNNTVKKCEIGPTASSGITVSGVNNMITDNHFHDCGYAGGYTTITVFASEYLEISNNTMANAGRAHIDFYSGELFKQNVIKNNHFINAMILCSDGGSFYTSYSDGGGTEFHHNFIEQTVKGDQGNMMKLIIGFYMDGFSKNYTAHHNIIKAENITNGLQINTPSENAKIYNNTIIGADVGIFVGFDGRNTAKDIIINDNLLVNNKHAYAIGWLEGETIADFTNGRIAANGVTSSGNTSGTVDAQYRPTGDTPNVGAIPKDGTMFSYGASWKLGAAPAPAPAPTPTPTPAATVTTSPTANKVLVDGKEVAFDAYNINDENYFKLRDVAFVLNGTRVQFNAALVDGAINIYKNTAYEPNGSEMQSKGEGSKEATLNKMKILIDGVETELTAYLIDGNNYFKMRELAQTFDFYPAYDGTITIDTTKPYGG
ncbi:MAG: right-handed parallel beta-helix repeat-containing protein [Oscillospiraceae bacterium]|nr:right-handed parallel beta-helix repeat-containing protein [Oscillospiraceae bacterium]